MFFGNQGEWYFNFKLIVDDRMVVFVIIQVVLDEVMLFNIVVDLDFQCWGLGCMLFEYLIDELEKCGVVMLWLEVCVFNVVVIVLYESLGFNEVMICCNYYFMV